MPWLTGRCFGRPAAALVVRRPSGAAAELGVSSQNPPCCCCHCWNLPVSKGCESVQLIGHPINHSIHVGFNLPPLAPCSSATTSSRLLLCWFFKFKRGLHGLVICLRGVGHNPTSFPVVWCAHVRRSHNTPLRIKPHVGKVSEHAGKSSSHKER